jgi:hypothetical protein
VRSVALETTLSLRDAANIVNAAFAKMKANVESVGVSPNPLDQFDGAADIAAVGQRATLTDSWTVRVYLYDVGDKRGVELVALGEGGFTRARRGVRNTASFTRSVQRMDALVAVLRARDPGAQLIG